MSEVSRERRITWLARIGLVALRALATTWRLRLVNDQMPLLRARGESAILATWHGQLLPELWALRDRNLSVMISEHADGEIVARVALALGYRTVRGSTTRGAARALLAAAREVDAGYDLAITVDGPKGPVYSVAPGALVIAQRTGAPLVPMGAWASRAWRLRSWDSFMIPKPFARVCVAHGAPIYIDSDSARKAAEAGNTLRVAIDAAAAAAAAGAS